MLQKLFKGRNYSRAETIHGNTVFEETYFENQFLVLWKKYWWYRLSEALAATRLLQASKKIAISLITVVESVMKNTPLLLLVPFYYINLYWSTQTLIPAVYFRNEWTKTTKAKFKYKYKEYHRSTNQNTALYFWHEELFCDWLKNDIYF